MFDRQRLRLMTRATWPGSIALAAVLSALVASVPGRVAAQAPSPSATLDLRQGDRIALVGNTLAERQQLFNHFETQLLTRFADLDLIVRNLGWSADTLTLQPRPLNFGDATTHLTRQQADVVMAFFGVNESFEGEAGLPQFERDLDAYLRVHQAARYNGETAPQVLLVSPIAHERLAHLVHVDVEARNRDIARYTETMRRVAAQRGVPFVDLFTPTRTLMAHAAVPLTINGIHLTEAGDRMVSGLLLAGIGAAPAAMRPAGPAEVAKLDTLREAIRDKNQQFFYRWRPVNAEYIVGRRVEPFGAVNFPGEMQQLDEMVAERERTIWTLAKGLRGVRYPDVTDAEASAAVSRRSR